MPDTDDGYNDQDDSGNQPDYDDDDSDNSAGLLDGVDTFLGMLPQLVISGVIVVVVIQVINVFNGPMVTTIGNAFGNMFATGTELLKQVPTWVIMYVALQGSTLLINVLIAYISNRSSNPRDKVTTAEEVKLRKKQILNGEIIIDTNRYNASNTGESSNAANRQSKYLHNQGRVRGVKDLDHYFQETSQVEERVDMGTDKVSANAKKQIAGAFFTELQNLGRLQTAIVDAFPNKEAYMEAVRNNPDAVRKQAERIITEAGVRPATLETARFLFGKKYGEAARELNVEANRNRFIDFMTLSEAQYAPDGSKIVGFESAEMDGEVARFFSEGKSAVFTPNDANKIMMLARAGENTVYEAARAVSKDAKFKDGDFGKYFNRKGRSFLSRVTGFESFTDSLVFETCGANIMQEQVDKATGKVTVDGNAANMAMHYSTNSENSGTGASFDSGLRDFRSKYISNNPENPNGRPPSLSTTDPSGGGVRQQGVQLRSEGGYGSNRMLEPDSIDLAHLSDFDYKLLPEECAYFWADETKRTPVTATNVQPTGSGNNPPATGAYQDLRSLIDQNLDVEGQSGTNKVTAMSAIDYMERQLNPMYEAMKKIEGANQRVQDSERIQHNTKIYTTLGQTYNYLRQEGLKNVLFPDVESLKGLSAEQQKAIEELLKTSEAARDQGTGKYTRDSHAQFREKFTVTQAEAQSWVESGGEEEFSRRVQEKFQEYGEFGKYLADANKHVLDVQVMDGTSASVYLDTKTNVMSQGNQALSLMKSDISANKQLIVATTPYDDPEFGKTEMTKEEWDSFQKETESDYKKAAYSKGDLDAIRNATVSIENKAADIVKKFNEACIKKAQAISNGKTPFAGLSTAEKANIVDEVRQSFATTGGMSVDVAMAVFSEDYKGTSRQANSVTQRLAFGKYDDKSRFVTFNDPAGSQGDPSGDPNFIDRVNAELQDFPKTANKGKKGNIGQYNSIADAVKTSTTRSYNVDSSSHSIAGRMLTVELTGKRFQNRGSFTSAAADGNNTGKTRVKVQGFAEPQTGHPIHAMDQNLWDPASAKQILNEYFDSLGVDSASAFEAGTTVDTANPNSKEFRTKSPYTKETALKVQQRIHESMDVCYNTDYLRQRLQQGKADAPLRAIESPMTSVTPRVAIMETLTSLDRIKDAIKSIFPDVGKAMPGFGTDLEKMLVTGADASLLNPKGSGMTFESSVAKQLQKTAETGAFKLLKAQNEEEKRSRAMEEETRKQRMEGYEGQPRKR